MDWSRLYKGDTVLYQGTTCANTVTKGEYYTVLRPTEKPQYGIIIDDSGNEKLIKMGYLFAKVDETHE